MVRRIPVLIISGYAKEITRGAIFFIGELKANTDILLGILQGSYNLEQLLSDVFNDQHQFYESNQKTKTK